MKKPQQAKLAPSRDDAQRHDPPGGFRVKRNTIIQLAFIAMAAVAVYGFVQAAQIDQRRGACTPLCAMAPAYAGRNRLAPDFELPDMSGNLVKLSSFRGKTVLLNFWTKTCEPCKAEMPSLAELAASLARRPKSDIVLLTISTDEGPDAVRDTLAVLLGTNKLPFPVLFDPDLTVVREKFGTVLYPETWIIDKDGVVRIRFDGERDWSSALALEVAESVAGRAPACRVDWEKGKAKGPFAALCESD